MVGGGGEGVVAIKKNDVCISERVCTQIDFVRKLQTEKYKSIRTP